MWSSGAVFSRTCPGVSVPFSPCPYLGGQSGDKAAGFPCRRLQISLTAHSTLAGSTQRTRLWPSRTRPTWGWQVGGPPRSAPCSPFLELVPRLPLKHRPGF